MPNNLNETLNKFMTVTARSKVAVVVPLFGYWKDMPSQQLNADTLKYSLSRIYSSVHQLYFIFVGDQSRISEDVANVIISKTAGGNSTGIAAKPGDSYPDYLHKGIDAALKETEAQFVVVVNPWMMIQHNGLDIMIDRVNRDDAKIVTGYDLRGMLKEDAAQFPDYRFATPTEQRDLNINFIGMKRYAAEMAQVDTAYKTHSFIGVDLMARIYQQGFDCITTQKIPIYSFDVDWTELENDADFMADKNLFISKWRFDPAMTYGK